MAATAADPASFGGLLYAAKKALRESQIDTPDLDAEVLFAHALERDRLHMLADPPRKISNGIMGACSAYIERRRNGEPVAYITGEKHFYNSVFKVNRSVLIPRPETEIMVDEILKRFNGDSISVCDIGTGSGCIALSLANERPSWNITAADVSEKALETAIENARHICLEVGVKNVNFIQSDLFENIIGKFDLITCNPPYIAESDKESLQKEIVRHEPHTALFAREGGLEIIKRVVSDAPQFLKDNGRLYCEIGYGQKEAVGNFFNAGPWERVEFIKDLAGHFRHVTGRRLHSTK
ncbi:MAG: peptide chain release factor N(5)-glutamine methyltransferase [Nitrospinota bacterium]